MRLPTVTRCSCIASSSALCVFGVARLISSARTMFAKIGPLAELEDLAAALRLVDDRRAEDVGRHEVGRELDARERERERLGERAHEHRLAEAGHALEQRVAAGEHAGDDAVDHLAVADDRLRDLGAKIVDALAEARDLLAHGLGLGHLTARCSSGWLGAVTRRAGG